MKKILVITLMLLSGCATVEKPMLVAQFPVADTAPIEMTAYKDTDLLWNTLINEYFIYIEYSRFDLDNKMIQYNMAAYRDNYFDCGTYIIYDGKKQYEINPLAKKYEYTKTRGNFIDTYTVTNDVNIKVRVKMTKGTDQYFPVTDLKAVIFYNIKQVVELRSTQTGDAIIGKVVKNYRTNNYRPVDIRFNDKDISCTTDGYLEKKLKNELMPFL